MNCTWIKQKEVQIAIFLIAVVFLFALHQNAEYISVRSADIYRLTNLSNEELKLTYGDEVGQERENLSDKELRLMHGDAIAQERRNRTDRACAAMYRSYNQARINWNLWAIRKRPRLFYSQDCQILVCDTPKCGSSQWRNAILILDGLVNATSSDELMNITKKSFDLSMERFFWKTINTKVAKGRDRANEMLKNYYKIMTVREPLERLVSAYKEKLEKEGNYYYTPISRNIHKRFSKNPMEDGLATFSEFVDFILSVKDPTTLDVHWMRYTDLCKPCKMKYDYIVKMETIYDDIDYITTKLGIDRRTLFPDSKGKELRKKWNSKYFKYYDQLLPAKRTKIFEFYKPQYDFFGYEYPEFIYNKTTWRIK